MANVNPYVNLGGMGGYANQANSAGEDFFRKLLSGQAGPMGKSALNNAFQIMGQAAGDDVQGNLDFGSFLGAYAPGNQSANSTVQGWINDLLGKLVNAGRDQYAAPLVNNLAGGRGFAQDRLQNATQLAGLLPSLEGMGDLYGTALGAVKGAASRFGGNLSSHATPLWGQIGGLFEALGQNAPGMARQIGGMTMPGSASGMSNAARSVLQAMANRATTPWDPTNMNAQSAQAEEFVGNQIDTGNGWTPTQASGGTTDQLTPAELKAVGKYLASSNYTSGQGMLADLNANNAGLVAQLGKRAVQALYTKGKQWQKSGTRPW